MHSGALKALNRFWGPCVQPLLEYTEAEVEKSSLKFSSEEIALLYNYIARPSLDPQHLWGDGKQETPYRKLVQKLSAAQSWCISSKDK